VVTQIAVGWDPFTRLTRPSAPPVETQRGSPALVALLTDAQAPLHPALYTDRDLIGGDTPTAVSYPANGAHGVRVQLSDWADPKSLDEGPVHLHFAANWLASRGWGSCYVVLPSLLANGAFAATQNALAALLQRPVRSAGDVHLAAEAQPPSFGRIALATAGSLSSGDTSPAPSDYEAIAVDTHGTLQQRISEFSAGTGKLGPVWACTPSDNFTFFDARAPGNIPNTGSFAGDACGVVAVVDAPAASDIRATVLIVVGVFIAISFERLFYLLSQQPEEASNTDGGASGSESSKGESP
jgi:hypothetical protein